MADKRYLINPGTQFMTFSKITIPVINVTTKTASQLPASTSTADSNVKAQNEQITTIGTTVKE